MQNLRRYESNNIDTTFITQNKVWGSTISPNTYRIHKHTRKFFYTDLIFGLNLKIRYFKGKFEPQNSLSIRYLLCIVL